MRKFLLFGVLTLIYAQLCAQVVVHTDEQKQEFSVIKHVFLADAVHKNYTPQNVRKNQTGLHFKKLTSTFGNLGFTEHTYWATFKIVNASSSKLHYYLEAGVPMTDTINCYIFDEAGHFSTQKNGDNIPFASRSMNNRRPVFEIRLNPKQTKEVFIEFKNDGERNSLPINLLTESKLLEQTYHEQALLGLFYGVLLIITITYLFFFFALNERSFLYYSLYVLFVGLCQFALDGLFHQYIDRSASWLNRYSVILFAILAAFFLGKYSEVILAIKTAHKRLYRIFKATYILLGFTLAGIVFIPSFLPFSYPVVNLLTLVGMLLIFASFIYLLIKKQKIDGFFMLGITILFLTIATVIFSNFDVIIHSVSVDNITKLGIGLEIIALSLSMAKRIHDLKSTKEELQTIALQRSNEVNDMKSFFLSNMSHELRTPLNAIFGTTSIMVDEATNDVVKAQCEIIRDASVTLISSVNDILDFSMIERGQLQLDASPFKPHEILLKMSTRAGRKAKDNGLHYTFTSLFNADISVMGDANRLEQMVYNILSNAVKFTATGSVNFQADGFTEEDRFYLRLKFEDTGVGISKEKLAAGFQLFSQSMMDNKRRFGGFGIGLCVVNALIDLHKGEFKLESQLNIGTTCFISLEYPLAQVEDIVPAVPLIIPNVPIQHNHILVVEDNPINQTVIKMILKKWDNTSVLFASDGSEALEILRKNTIDLVLLDLQMPVMDGYEVLTAIRNGETGNLHTHVPVIVLTADVVESTKERVFALGADDFMTKPVDKNLLHQKVQALLIVQKQEVLI